MIESRHDTSGYNDPNDVDTRTDAEINRLVDDYWTHKDADNQVYGIILCAFDELYNLNKTDDYHDVWREIKLNIDKMPTLKKHLNNYIREEVEAGNYE